MARQNKRDHCKLLKKQFIRSYRHVQEKNYKICIITTTIIIIIIILAPPTPIQTPFGFRKNTVETKDASIQCVKLYRVSLYSGCPCILLTAFLLSNKCDFFCGVFLLPPFGRRARLEQQAAAGKIVASTAVHDGAVYVEGDNI